MKHFFKVAGGIVAALTTALLLLLWASDGFWPISMLRGRIAANIDVAHGRYKELAYGLPIREIDEYTQLLKNRYGIDVQFVAFCTPTRSEIDFADAYDQISMEAAKRKFGRDVFKEAYDEVAKPQTAHVETGHVN
jgi:hypothetical protein